jgi:hypothetical protein
MPAFIKTPCLLLCSTDSRNVLSSSKSERKIMTKEVAIEHKSRLLKSESHAFEDDLIAARQILPT